VPCYRLTLEYDGRAFEGWQVQAGGRRTVQGVLEEAVGRVAGERVRVVGAGRTDAGVHAEGQVASFELRAEREPERLALALNGVLPPDLAVLGAERAPEGFHARYDARAKLYRYEIWNGRSRSPLRRDRSHWVVSPLDLEAMRRAASDLAGRHDFRSFQASGSSVRSTVRTLCRLDLEGQAGAGLRIVACADGFLRHMVRVLAGTLVEVGRGRRDPAGMPALLAARDRAQAGPTAPARALTLVRVDY
jgi:tRNA pseudouridine38-40 synthase